METRNFPVVIALNGPPGIGKSWLGMRIANVIQGSRRIFSLRDVIWSEVQPRFGWRGGYEDFKNTVFEDGLDGRQHLINYAEEKRSQETHYWDKRYVESPLFRHADIIINDSLRKWEEHEWLAAHSKELITIVMAPTKYSIGCIYEGDSGICLPPRGGFRVTDSNKGLEGFKEFWSRRNNDSCNTTGTEEEQIRRSALMGGFVGESGT